MADYAWLCILQALGHVLVRAGAPNVGTFNTERKDTMEN
jgi:hypothetical protein